MSMVQLALRRPYTFIVMALLIVLATPFALRNMATRHLPGNQHSGDQHHLELRRPVGLKRWARRISAQSDADSTTSATSSTSNSQSLAGIAVTRSSSANRQHPDAIAQVVASMQTQVRQLPRASRRRW